MTIRPPTRDEMQIVRELFLEYGQSLGFSLCFQGFQQELDTLPGKYAQPAGIILLGMLENQPAGVVAMRDRGGKVAEMKRLYVRPAYRGKGLGEQLTQRLLAEASWRGYEQVVLDTAPSMQAAQRLYTRLGFEVIPAYYDNAEIGSVCMGKRITPGWGTGG